MSIYMTFYREYLTFYHSSNDYLWPAIESIELNFERIYRPKTVVAN
jgi:hypothetical protein